MTTRMTIALAAILGMAATTDAQSPVSTPPIKIAAIEPLPAEHAPILMADPGVPAAGSDQWYPMGDVLFAWIRGSGLPPLVTTSPQGTALSAAGVLGQPGTRTVFGHEDVNEDLRFGFRLGVGGWFDSDHHLGIDAGFFMLESQNTPLAASSQGNPILARPFVDATTGIQSSQIVAFPGAFTGSVAVSDRSGNLYGAHVDLQEELLACNCFHLQTLLGYRFLRLDDGLSVGQSVTAVGAAGLVPGTQIQTADHFNAENEFHGADFGLRAEVHYDQFTLGLLTKLAVGSIHREVTIEGSTVTTVPGSAPVTAAGGMLALSSNSGVHTSDDWVVVPEIGVRLAYQVNSNLCVSLGYTLLIWTDVARAGDQVNLNINPQLFPPVQAGATPASPGFGLVKSDLWVQTLSLGVEFRY